MVSDMDEIMSHHICEPIWASIIASWLSSSCIDGINLDMDETINGWTNLGEHYRILLTRWLSIIAVFSMVSSAAWMRQCHIIYANRCWRALSHPTYNVVERHHHLYRWYQLRDDPRYGRINLGEHHILGHKLRASQGRHAEYSTESHMEWYWSDQPDRSRCFYACCTYVCLLVNVWIR